MTNHMVQMSIIFFYVTGFLGLVALDNVMPHMSGDYGSWVVDDGNHVMVSNPSEMISIVALVIKASGRVLKP
jgi:hypothetical protein